MASLDERMFSEFEDIQDDSSAAAGSGGGDDSDNYMPERRVAKNMVRNEIMHMLQEFGAPFKGFEDEDAETLQKILDEKYEEELETKRAERKEARMLAAKQVRHEQ